MGLAGEWKHAIVTSSAVAVDDSRACFVDEQDMLEVIEFIDDVSVSTALLAVGVALSCVMAGTSSS